MRPPAIFYACKCHFSKRVQMDPLLNTPEKIWLNCIKFSVPTNPCKCGYYPDMQKCTCTDYEIRRYRNRISQPLLDRMDLCVKVEKVHYQELEQTTQEESSESIRERVVMAHKRQRERYEKEGFFYNSQIPAKKIATFCALKKDEKRHMQQIYETLNLSVRSYHKILKTARTIADIEGSEEIRMEHLHEAICYRSIDSNFWERRR